ncbi:hypothetical protein TrRE_jg9393 [Triparma retinervis]|uniref:peptidylprolyl isomerase n=1 Tax=Triparma retinervis TaxID=2557542 RepID=A0A9W7A107_9STRA|nr:hypothetical protein TrRE_jg9393 [Triparma retinervis]
MATNTAWTVVIFVAIALSTSSAYYSIVMPLGAEKRGHLTKLSSSRREIIDAASVLAISGVLSSLPSQALAGTPAATSSLQSYPDFIRCPSGIQVKDVAAGVDGAPEAKKGDRVAKGGPTGGAFDKDTDYMRTTIGSGTMVKGLEEGLIGMKQGQIRQIIVPDGPLSYPPSDYPHEVVGPKPSTFSGQRALNFVLQNEAGTIDKTLLFNVKVVRVDVEGVVDKQRR